jgi:CRP/FNR family cyclic AMP-dependent transcriptional regulator
MSRKDERILASFIGDSAWGKKLERSEFERVLAVTSERVIPKNCAVVNAATVAQHWVGVIRGFVAQSVSHADGHATFLSAVGDGAWFGEGTLIKRTCWGYDAVALHETRVALVPLSMFEWLRQTSLPFNHFLQTLMNARMSSFIGQLVSSRHASTEARVAMALANLFTPELHARDRFVRISQAELALLAGTSRQRANEALKRLQEMGLVSARRQGVDVLELHGLKTVALSEQ